uniref:Uncharacterized protein n=1 Tax=Polytomella parva TaxID=51329 RepID=A0A7S0UKS6_9CHLO
MFLISIDVEVSVIPYAPQKVCLALSILAMISSFITLGGISGLQENCSSNNVLPSTLFSMINGLTSTNQCRDIFRWYWFITISEFLLATFTIFTCLSRRFYNFRYSLVGLFVIFCVLFIVQSDTFLNVSELEYYVQNTTAKHRARVMVGGSIMSAVSNLLLVLAIGTNSSHKTEMLLN